tara:strand:- start:410 stop:742 length:333 start_codon:yes stop_codon:yes gene_type:complete
MYDQENKFVQSYIKKHFTPDDYKTKHGAAKALHAVICKVAKIFGHNPDIEVSLMNPEKSEACGYGKQWRVMWEAGPYEWAIGVSLSSYGSSSKNGWFTEPYYSFDLGFCN